MVLIINPCVSQNANDTLKPAFKEKTKKDWNLGALPFAAYDADLGLRYGAFLSLYNYGDGSNYPMYNHFFYIAWFKTTKGNTTISFVYDSKHLFKGIRTTFDFEYISEKALDFYGFNGYKSLYNHDFELKDNSLYKSRMFYRLDRKLLMLLADFQKDLTIEHLKLIFGINFYDVAIGSVNIDNLNKGKKDEDKLPSTDSVPGLYDNYVKWNVISDKEKNGGQTAIAKIGFSYDTRDNEPNPMKGIWSEAMLLYAPDLGSNFSSYSEFVMTHRQYFTLKRDILNLACRFNYQTKLSGDIPYYMLPFVQGIGKTTRDGLGGAKTVRGILRDRVVGDGMAFGNIELRWKLFRKIISKQNIYTAFSVFTDGGLVTKKYSFNFANVPVDMKYMFPKDKETIHTSYGAGLHIVMNQNFVITFDYGIPFKKADGTGGFYINLDFLF